VVLIDTPGFGDTTQSDADILRTIAAFLGASYERGGTLAGILYFHRISDLRMSGALTGNFRMFQNLCGDMALRNVVIVTNMWGGVEPEIGEARETELRTEGVFFKPALDKGTRMARHENTDKSAEAIVRLLIDNNPLPLQIQKELINERKDIVDTNAGRELNRELNGEIRKHQEEIRVLAEEMEQAMRDMDEETRMELEIETQRMREEIERFEDESKRLASDYQREKKAFQARLEEMERVRRDGSRSAQRPRYLPRSEGHGVWSPPTVPYPSTLSSFPTTGRQFVDTPRRVSNGRDYNERGHNERGYLRSFVDLFTGS